MLTLGLSDKEDVVIRCPDGAEIRLCFVSSWKNNPRLGIEAPKAYMIERVSAKAECTHAKQGGK